MDTGTDHLAAFRGRLERGRHQRTDRREDDGGVELFGRALVRAAGPVGTEATGKSLAFLVAGPGEGENAAALVLRNLSNDVGRGAEAVKAEAPSVTDQAQRAIADQPGTK